MKCSYHRDISHYQLIIEKEESFLGDTDEENMLLRQEIPGFVRFSMRCTDGQTVYLYDVDTLITLKDSIEKEEIDDRQAALLIRQLVEAFEQTDAYFLNTDSIVLQETMIFYDACRNSYRFVYCPGYCMAYTEGLQELAMFLMKHVNHKDEEAVLTVYGLYRMVQQDNYHIHDFLGLLNVYADTSAEKESHNVIRQNGGQSGTKKDMAEKGGEKREVRKKEMPERKMPERKVLERKMREREILENEEISEEILPEWNPDAGPWMDEAGLYRQEERGASLLTAHISIYGIMAFLTGIGGVAGIFCHQRLISGILIAASGILSLAWYRTQFPAKKKDEENQEEKNWCCVAEADGNTVLLSDIPRNVLLKSLDKDMLEDIRIQAFPCIIGKTEGAADVCVNEPSVSRRHAMIFWKEQALIIQDLHSTNGTFINGKVIKAGEVRQVFLEDIVQFADARYIIKY